MKLTDRTQQLLKAAAEVAPSAITSAAATLADQQAKVDAANALKILEKCDSLLKSKVQNLRDIRKMGKDAEENLEKFDTAFANFLKDGDVDKLSKATGYTKYQLGVSESRY